MKCDSQASFLACNLAYPCFGRKPKVKVVIVGALGSYKFYPFRTPIPPPPMYIQLVVKKVQPCNNMFAHLDFTHYPFSNSTNNLLSY
jgi:hypothetical protein